MKNKVEIMENSQFYCGIFLRLSFFDVHDYHISINLNVYLNTAAAQPGTEIFNLPAVTTSGKIICNEIGMIGVNPANTYGIRTAS